MKNGIVESAPKAYRPVAKIGANVVFKVCASNWPLWNQGIDTVMQLKEKLRTKFHGPWRVVRIISFEAVQGTRTYKKSRVLFIERSNV